MDSRAPDSVREGYLEANPADLTVPALAAARATIDAWSVDLERRFMTGADLRAWFGWHGIELDKLSPGELVRMAALVRVFEAHPSKAAKMPTFAIWLVVGRNGQQRRAA